ncbi:ATP-binding protein [Streptomyces sp. NPDC087270]|uniref:ATP-binding protein n=1 Tax=Streptomyces sp. NPDC087270 TaxID=3365774 RepID=UPI0037F193B5
MSLDTGFCSRLDLTCEPASIQLARDHTRQTLARWGVAEEVAFDALTVVSELATNAVRHAAMPRSSGEQPQRWSCSMLLCPAAGSLYVSVGDQSPLPPVLRSAGEHAESGRGLHIISALCHNRWGFERSLDGRGKHVWAALQLACRDQPPQPLVAGPVVLPPALCDAALALPPTEGTDPTDVDRDLRCILQAHSSGDHQALVRELPA